MRKVFDPFPSLGTHLDVGRPERQSPAVSESVIKVPADMIAAGDSPLGTSYLDPRSGQSACLSMVLAGSTRSTPNYLRSPSHGLNTVVVFCDGHVESVKRTKLYGISNRGMTIDNWAFCRWRTDHLPLPGPD